MRSLKLLPALAALLVFIIVSATSNSSAVAAPQGAATGLSFGDVSCQADGTLSATLQWVPSGAGAQYVDLAVDSGFTNLSTGGPFANNADRVQLTPLRSGATYYARIRTATPSQTLSSDILTVSPGTCGGGHQPPAAVSGISLASNYSGKCLEIAGKSQANLAPADQWTCGGGANQVLQVVPQGGGYVSLRFAHTGKCLEALNWQWSNGSALGQYDCHGGDNQLWAGNFAGGGPTTIRNKFSQRCIDVFDWRRNNGSPLVQWDCHAGANQQWAVLGGQASLPPSAPTTGPVIALTIDTDLIRGYASQVLDVLDQYGVKASFGVTGVFATNNPDLVQRMARSGHTIMNHSWSHPNFNAITTTQRIDELQYTDNAILAAAGVSTKPYFRPPYGNVNSDVQADVASIGYRPVLWTIDPQGWRGYSADVIESNILDHAANGAIILMHSTDYGDYAALGPTIAALQAQGYRFVTISQLLP